MRNSNGWWFPDGETHFPQMVSESLKHIGRAEYQHLARNKSLQYVKKKRTAIDIGANVGLWSRPLADIFERVICFEPVEIFAECWHKNMAGKNALFYQMALGNEVTMIDMVITPRNMGKTHVNPNTIGKGQIPMSVLDAYSFTNVDYIKIDCEGYELPVLEGAKNTILQNKPIIILEQKSHPYFSKFWGQKQGIKFLESLGMKHLDQVNDDHVLGF